MAREKKLKIAEDETITGAMLLPETEEVADVNQVSLLDYVEPAALSASLSPERSARKHATEAILPAVLEADTLPLKTTGTRTMKTPETTGGQLQTVNPEAATLGNEAADLFTVLDPQDADSLLTYATKAGLTKTGITRFAMAILSERFRGHDLKVLDLTPHLEAKGYLDLLQGAVLHMRNRTELQPNPLPRAGFTFDSKAPQKAFYLRGTVHSELSERPEGMRWTQGLTPANYLLLPETIPGVQAKAEASGAMGPKLEPYNPILRMLSHVVQNDNVQEVWFNNIRGAALDPQYAKASSEFAAKLPQFVYEILYELGQTDEDLLVTETTYEEMARKKMIRQQNGGRRRGIIGQANLKPADVASAVTSAPANAGMQNALDRLGG